MIDTHVHLDCLADPDQAVADARRSGVAGFVVPGIAPAGWDRLMATVSRFPDGWAAPGIHPLAVDRMPDNALACLERLTHNPRVVALGEVGLDRQAAAPRERQEEVLRRVIALARETGLPLLLHVRQGLGRLLEILKAEGAGRVGGILHAFNGSLETARQAIDLGFALGIGGVVTYPEARRLPEVVRQVPAEWLVLETDAPDMAPHPHRGEANRPAHLPLVLQKVAELRQSSPTELDRVTTANAARILSRLDLSAKGLA